MAIVACWMLFEFLYYSWEVRGGASQRAATASLDTSKARNSNGGPSSFFCVRVCAQGGVERRSLAVWLLSVKILTVRLGTQSWWWWWERSWDQTSRRCASDGKGVGRGEEMKKVSFGVEKDAIVHGSRTMGWRNWPDTWFPPTYLSRAIYFGFNSHDPLR